MSPSTSLTSLVFLVLCSVCFGQPGRKSSWHGRLSGPANASLAAACGESTTTRDNPWAAILWFDNTFICGATLLDSNLAITSAHCVIGKRTDFFVLYYGRTFQPDTGIEDRGAFRFGGNTPLEAVRIHPNYDSFNKFEGFDIALLKLKRRVQFNELVKPILVVPTATKYNKIWEDGAKVQMAGFGQVSGPLDSSDSDDYPQQMQMVEHRIVQQQQCNRGNDTLRFGPPRDVLCTRGKCRRNQGSSNQATTYKQICPGDSGSGIVGYYQEENRYYLLGVASYLIAPNNEDCGKSNKPAFSINARFHRDFIYEDFSWTDSPPVDSPPVDSPPVDSPPVGVAPVDSPSVAVAPVDCRWTHWTDWTQCSQRCGGGQSSRTRQVAQEASHGGVGCTGDLNQNKSCNNAPCGSIIEETDKSCPRANTCETRGTCPYIAAKYQDIKNLGKSEANKIKRKLIVDQLKGAICNKKQKGFCCPKSAPVEPDIFGPSVTPPPKPISVWSEWGSWSSCTVSCGEGTQGRRRSCPSSDCKTSKGEVFSSQSQIRSCNTNNCPQVLVWAEWQPWSRCSQSCGGGIQSRIRSKGKEQQSQRQSCNNNSCPSFNGRTNNSDRVNSGFRTANRVRPTTNRPKRPRVNKKKNRGLLCNLAVSLVNCKARCDAINYYCSQGRFIYCIDDCFICGECTRT